MKDITIEKLAFETEPNQGFVIKCFYLSEPKGDALVEIHKGSALVKEFLFPAYKIWNIAAHESDIIDGLVRESENGLLIAGSDGLGGNAYEPATSPTTGE